MTLVRMDLLSVEPKLKQDWSKPSVTLDKSAAMRTFSSYVAVWFWMGWLFFYAVLVLIVPILFVYSKFLLSCILGVISLSAVYTIDRDKQPKVGFVDQNYIY